jgi:hypothetical protein
MISSSAASLRASGVQSLRMSLGGMLVCIFACTLALLSVSRDWTGTKTSEVRRAFEASLQAYGQPADDEKKEASEENRFADRTAAEDRSPLTGGMQKAGGPEPGRTGPKAFDFPSEALVSDTSRAGFLSLLNELDRFCRLSPVDRYAGELAFDFLSLEDGSEAQVAREAAETIRLIKTESPTAVWDFEVIIWAHSPSEESLSTAVLKSWRVQQAVQETVGTDSADLSITSSGRLWLQSDDLRPVLTLVARRQLSSYSVAQEFLQP